MGRALTIGGVILLVIGLALVGLNLYGDLSPSSTNAPAGSVSSWQPAGVGPFVTTVKWSGASSGSTIYVSTVQPNSADPCAGQPSGVVATGTGASGSLSVTLNGGTTYYLVACPIAAGSVTLTIAYSVGLGTLMIIGAILIVIALVLIAVSRRRGRRASSLPTNPP